jgi:O-antigen/teichoic acid export membrane protein
MEGAPSMKPVRAQSRPRNEIAWGVVDQALSSATNLGIAILAGRLLGPAGLGVIFLGFSTYLFALSFVRALITEPFVVATAAFDRAQREAATRACMILVIVAAIALSALMAVIGLVVADPLGRSLLVFAPWVAVALVQDQWRSVLFRDQRGAAAAFNDGVWAAGMIAMLPFAWAFPHDWSIAATWGVGAGVAAVVGLWQVRLRPSRLADAARWWKRELRRLGSWLAIENIILTAGSQATVILLAAELGASDLGGIRAVEVLFAPMTLIGEAFAFPGVPILSRALATSAANARQWAWKLGLGAAILVGFYLGVAGPFSAQVLSRVFGPEFAIFTSLVLPIALAQLLRAASTGFSVLLKADRRVHAIVACRAITTAVVLVLAPLGAYRFGVLGAVWGLALGSAVGSTATILCGLLSHDIAAPRERGLLASGDV